MSDDGSGEEYNGGDASPPRPAPPKKPKGDQGGDKRLSVERIYQKKTQLEHILLRPDTYIGSVQPVTEQMWVYENEGMVLRDVTYVPGFYKIFDEILVNAADNKQRDPKMDTIKIDIKPEENLISIMNNGKGIPVVEHKDEKMFVPTMIFGHLLTSSNFNDEQEKVTGGRNGFGAKLCNVFSTKFIVETADKKVKKSFKQTWGANMSKTTEPKIKEFSGEEFTRITFSPDLAKFNLDRLDEDHIALMSRRAFDIAASARGVKVFLNGKRLPVKNFKDYVDQFIKGKEDETGAPLKCVYEQCGERWEVAVCVSDKGFQQMSFVNSIATTKGGRHVDYVTEIIIKGIIDTIKKKNKTGINIKPFQVKNHLWVFINCLIVNPTFDSQTKETMTLAAKSFGSKCVLSEKFQQQLMKTGIIESVLAWSKFKADQQLKSKQSGKKTNKLRGMAKLEDANEAGTKNSSGCTLILTEGDSAKTLAVAGLGVIGRDYYGVYPLKGKLLNVREATHKQIMENKEINDLVKIMGLTYKKKYETMDDLKSLRYGKIMIMTDQDQDGSHIKGLVINFIHHNWPSLLKLPFLEEFITPIVKASKGSIFQCFYSLPEFTEWKEATENWPTWKIKYYKGLGTSTSNEAKEYFSDMVRHRIKFRYNGEQDDHSIQLAFSKKHIEQRKEWLTNWMEEGRRRKELGLSEVYLYEKDTRAVHYTDFVNKELVLFSNMDNERSIPSLVDGLKPGQRKVIFTCLKRNLTKKEIKVAQLSGSVAEVSAYHHGEMSLQGTIVNLAQNYVGSNNINLLLPIGQFGTRLAGGKDHASARYIFTQMSPLARHIFNEHDDAILNYLQDDNQRIEPEWYVPIIPMVLVNGADGIGTGWMTKIPNFNPREIIENLRRLIRGQEPKEMIPWFKNFKGSIEALDRQRFVVNGEISTLSDTKVEITELPVRTWTNNYKEFLETLVAGSEKAPAQIQDYKDYNTDKTVKFIVQMTSDKLRDAEIKTGLHTFFKLQTTISTTSMVLFDHLGCLKCYDNVEQILREFYTLRLEFYGKRKKYLEGMIGAEAARLSNQARFILEKCDGTIKIENKKKQIMIDELTRRGYDSDPVKAWKKSQATDSEESTNAEDGEDAVSESPSGGPDYDYLLGMKLWSLTEEKKNELLKQRDQKQQELKRLQAKTKEEMWEEDLTALLAKLDEVEAKEREEDEADVGPNAKKKAGGKKAALKREALPSPMGIRVVPRIADELKMKAAKAVAAKERKITKGDRKAIKSVMDDKDEFDMMTDDKEMNKSLSERLGATPESKKKKGFKQTKLDFKPAKGSPKKKGGKNPWSDDEDEDVSGSDLSDIVDEPVIPREKAGARRAAAVAKFDFGESESESDKGSDEEDMFENSGIAENKTTHKPKVVNDSEGSDFEPESREPSPPPKKKPAPKPKKKVVSDDEEDSYPAKTNGATNGTTNGKKKDNDVFMVVSDSDSDGDGGFAKKFSSKTTKAPPKKLTSSDDLYDNLMAKDKKVAKPAKEKVSKPKPTKKKLSSDMDSEGSDFLDDKPKKKPVAKKPKKSQSSGSEDEAPKPKKKAPPKKKKPFSDSEDEKPKTKKAKKSAMSDDSGSDAEFDTADIGPARDRPGRARKPVSYAGADESGSESG